MPTPRKNPEELNNQVYPETEQMIKDMEIELRRSLTGSEREAVRSEARRQVWLRKFVEFGNNVAAACAFCGIKRATFNEWCRLFPDFTASVSELTEAQLDMAELQLLTNIREGKEASLFFFLCNKGKARGWQHINKITNQQFNKIEVNVKYAQSDGNTRPVDAQSRFDSKPEKLELLTSFEETQ